MKLTITVTMGNDAMQNRGDAAEAVSSALLRLGYEQEFSDGDDGVIIIMDMNGNTVGKWEADAEPEDFPGVPAERADEYEREVAADEADTR